MNVTIGMPAYNEEASLSKLIDRIVQVKKHIDHPLQLVIVNDGSTDGTQQILDRYAARYPYMTYIKHETNKGLGRAMNTLLTYLVERGHPDDLIVTLDADNTHDPSIIPQLIDKLLTENLDIAIASRFAKGGLELGLSPARKLYSRGARLFFRIFFPIDGVTDYSSGYRVYRTAFLQRASKMYGGQLITSNGFECMAELLARFSKIGVRAGEFPLVLQYHLKETPSKMHVFRTVLGYFKLLGKIRKPNRLERKFT